VVGVQAPSCTEAAVGRRRGDLGPRPEAAGGRSRRLRGGHADRSTVPKPRAGPRDDGFRQPVQRRRAQAPAKRRLGRVRLELDERRGGRRLQSATIPQPSPRPIACTTSDEDGTIVCGGSAPGARAASIRVANRARRPTVTPAGDARVRPFASVARGNGRTTGSDDREQRAQRVARRLLTATIGVVNDGRAGACPRSSNVGAHERRDDHGAAVLS
jgi:hypothetical protein